MRYEWLESAVFYEVYPTSFYDANGDGTGDLQGIIEKLPYIERLGANAIWLNPCFLSPFRDGGYDIADYCTVDPRFGTNEDLRELFAQAKQHGIRILLDLVVGHTSIEHPWFIESQKDEENEHTDTYIWKPGAEPLAEKDGKFISGVAERADMFQINYYAIQPALNYGFYQPQKPWQNKMDDPAPLRNRQRVVDICTFWLKMGASGFRVDMANFMIKNDTNDKKGNIQFWNDVIPKVKQTYPQAVFVSEWFEPTQSVQKSSFDVDFNGGGMLYSTWWNCEPEDCNKNCFLGENNTHFKEAMATFHRFRKGVKDRGYQAATLGNHDRIRMSMGRDISQMKLVFAFHLTMPHIPFLYYGDEIGLPYRRLRSKDGGYGRTGSRTPMQWDTGKNCGFSAADELYLPVQPGDGRTVAEQEGVEGSLLETVRTLIRLRRTLHCLRNDSAYRIVRNRANPFVYHRESDRDEAYVVIAPKREICRIPLKFLAKHPFECISNNMTLHRDAVSTPGAAFAVFYRTK